MMWWMPAGMLLVGFFWILVVVALVAAVWWMVGQHRSGRLNPPSDRALEILRERYARGDITPDEFEARRRDLTT